MSGTIRTPSYIMTTQAVDNSTGLYTPAMQRDLAETYSGIPIYGTTQTGSFSTTLDMRGTMVLVNSAGLVTATIPLVATVAYQPGHMIHFRPIGAGMILLAKTGAATLISSHGSFTSFATGSWISVQMIQTDVWCADGDLA